MSRTLPPWYAGCMDDDRCNAEPRYPRYADIVPESHPAIRVPAPKPPVERGWLSRGKPYATWGPDGVLRERQLPDTAAVDRTFENETRLDPRRAEDWIF